MKRRKVTIMIPAFAMLFLILESRNAITFASQGIELSIRTVIPSLFPFFLISIYLTGNLGQGAGVIPILLSGFLGGYPVGAQAASESFRFGRITKDSANHLLMFCSQAGPAFLFGMVSAQFPEAKYVWMLWIVQLLSAASVAFLAHIPERTAASVDVTAQISFTRAMQSAIRAMASVCGWVVVFRVIAGFISLLPVNNLWQVLISGLLELSNGCIGLSAVEDDRLRFLMASVMLNFGGLCVLLQTASVIGQLDLRYYMLGKLLQTGFAVLLAAAFLGYYGAWIPIFGTFLLMFRWKTAKRSSIPAPVGV